MSGPVYVWSDAEQTLVLEQPVSTITVRAAKAFDQKLVDLFKNIGKAVRGGQIVPPKAPKHGADHE